MSDIFKDMQANVGCDYISTGEIWIWAVALLKQAEVCARYHINAGRSATSIVATDSVFLF